MLKIRLYMFLEEETHDDNGCHIEKLYGRKCVNMFYPNPMASPKENVIDILRQTFNRLCEDVAVTIDCETDLEFVFDKNKLPYMHTPEPPKSEQDGGAENG